MSSVIASARPWLASLWSAIASHCEPARDTTRRRKGLIFIRQVEHALKWLETLVQVTSDQQSGLRHVFRFADGEQVFAVQTDACPSGVGGFLTMHESPVAYWFDSVTRDDCRQLGAVQGHPSHQSELELLAVLISLRVFKNWLGLSAKRSRVFIRTDNMATLQAAMTFKAKSSILSALAAEVTLELAAQGMTGVLG